MSARRMAEGLAHKLSRRKILLQATGAAAAFVAALAGINPARAAFVWCPDIGVQWETNRRVGCCVLGFYADCPDYSCYGGSHNWWAWTCTYNGMVLTCYECCDWRCSNVSGNPLRPKGAASTSGFSMPSGGISPQR